MPYLVQIIRNVVNDVLDYDPGSGISGAVVFRDILEGELRLRHDFVIIARCPRIDQNILPWLKPLMRGKVKRLL